MPWAKPGYWSVYRLTCVPSGKSYIGLTSENVNRRWAQHRTHAFNEKRRTALGNALRKHGPGAFTLEVLQKCQTLEDAVAAERKLISLFKTMTPGGYNLTDGGECQKNLTAEARQKISVKARERMASPDARAKLSAAKKGRKMSLKAVENMRAARIGRRPSCRSIELLISRNKARAEVLRNDPVRQLERREKEAAKEAVRLARSEAKALRAIETEARKATREERKRAHSQKIAEFHRGRKRSDETRKRISEKAKIVQIGAVRLKNRSGVAGVFFRQVEKRWCAQITVDGKCFYLGSFIAVEAAIEARIGAEARYLSKAQAERLAQRRQALSLDGLW